jgi:hypothetical protein
VLEDYETIKSGCLLSSDAYASKLGGTTGSLNRLVIFIVGNCQVLHNHFFNF